MINHLAHLTSAVISVFLALEVMGTQWWHRYCHRQKTQRYLRGKYLCGHCVSEGAE